jgi:hypothetical protein
MVNLIVAEDAGTIPMDEIMRVLVPNGVLIAKSERAGKKPLNHGRPEMDEWNQYLYDAGKQSSFKRFDHIACKTLPVGRKPHVGRHHDVTASLSALVSANGRIFYIIDEGPKESIELPLKILFMLGMPLTGLSSGKDPYLNGRTTCAQ